MMITCSLFSFWYFNLDHEHHSFFLYRLRVSMLRQISRIRLNLKFEYLRILPFNSFCHVCLPTVIHTGLEINVGQTCGSHTVFPVPPWGIPLGVVGECHIVGKNWSKCEVSVPLTWTISPPIWGLKCSELHSPLSPQWGFPGGYEENRVGPTFASHQFLIG